MKAFKVTGTFKMGREKQAFTKEVACERKEEATELIFSDLGSRHKVKRYNIKIEKVEEISPDDINDSVVAFKAGGMKE